MKTNIKYDTSTIVKLCCGLMTMFLLFLICSPSTGKVLTKNKETTLKKSKEATPFTCAITEIGAPPGSIGFMPCSPVPLGCSTCATCRLLALKLDCPGCCIDSIVFNTGHNVCFSVCGALDDPTHPTWVSTDPFRMGVCNTKQLTLVPTNPPSTWCDGKSLIIRVCSAEPTKIGYAAFLNCGDTIRYHIFTY
jgi:hypothetical protein